MIPTEVSKSGVNKQYALNILFLKSIQKEWLMCSQYRVPISVHVFPIYSHSSNNSAVELFACPCLSSQGIR